MSAQSCSICPQKWYSNEVSKSHMTIINNQPNHCALTIFEGKIAKFKQSATFFHSSLKLGNHVFQRANFIAAQETIASSVGILKESLY